MPIIYVHGVATRVEERLQHAVDPALVKLIRHYLAPEIADDPDSLAILFCYWGNLGATFHWKGGSRPASRLLGMGAGEGSDRERLLSALEFEQVVARLPMPAAPARSTGGLTATGSTGASTASPGGLRLKDLSGDDLGDLMAATIQRAVSDPERAATLAVAADEVAHEPGTSVALAACTTLDAELGTLQQLIAAEEAKATGLAGMGPGWLQGATNRLSEAISRGVGLPGLTVSTIAAELRKPLNDFVTVFLGDVFTYLAGRGTHDRPGPIPSVLIEQLVRAKAIQDARGGEPIVVVSHSMGGQLVYDAVTHFLPRSAEHRDIRVDFWAATASQVGLFEELKLFQERDEIYKQGNPVPFPSSNLGHWWNVWDHNDFISYTARGIVAGVDDESYSSGMSLLGAHGGYLKRPSFFRRFKRKLAEARAQNWSR